MSKSISKFVKEQFPKYLLETDSMFPFFMEAYYEWMSKSQNPTGLMYDLDGIGNVDTKYQLFVDEFVAEYIDTIPDNIATDKTTLIKKITELYQSKGTNKSIELLFRILYDVEASVIDPSSYLFKPSAAKYIKPKAIRFNISSGSIVDTQDVAFTITSGATSYSLRFDYITKLDNDLWEGSFQTNQPIDITGSVTISSNHFTGIPVKTISKKTIIQKGSGFKVGDIYDVSTETGSGTKIKITRVDGTKLRSFDIIQFGTGYLTNFTFALSANTTTETSEQRNLTIDNNGVVGQYTSPDNIGKLVDSYQITKFTYIDNPNYFENNTYVGDLLTTGQTEVTGNQIQSSDNVASIYFELGYIFDYTGYYISSEGMPSDISPIQDGEYWQQFSYVIKSEKQYKEFASSVKSLVHPAGLRMFSEYNINKKIDLLIDINTFLSTFNQLVEDNANSQDKIESIQFLKNIQYYYDDVSVNGVGDTLSNNGNGLGFGEPEKFKLLDEIAFTLGKNILDEQFNVADAPPTINFQKYISEVANAAEQAIISYQKLLEDSTTTFDLPSTTFTKNVVSTIDYSLTYQEFPQSLAISPYDLLNVGDGSIFGIVDYTPELELQFGLEAILISPEDTLDFGDGSTFSTYAGQYVEMDNSYSNLAANILSDLNIGDGSTLKVTNTNYIVPTTDDVLVSGEPELDSIQSKNICGVILNPYYSIQELINTNTPYWQYGYTQNERISQ